MDNFADRLRKARVSAKLTQEQLGFEVEVTKSSVSAWENGRETPSFRVLQRLPEVLGCSLDYLLCVIDQPEGVTEAGTHYQSVSAARDKAEVSLLGLFRGLSAFKQKALLDLLRADK